MVWLSAVFPVQLFKGGEEGKGFGSLSSVEGWELAMPSPSPSPSPSPPPPPTTTTTTYNAREQSSPIAPRVKSQDMQGGTDCPVRSKPSHPLLRHKRKHARDGPHVQEAQNGVQAEGLSKLFFPWAFVAAEERQLRNSTGFASSVTFGVGTTCADALPPKLWGKGVNDPYEATIENAYIQRFQWPCKSLFFRKTNVDTSLFFFPNYTRPRSAPVGAQSHGTISDPTKHANLPPTHLFTFLSTYLLIFLLNDFTNSVISI